MLKPQTQDRYEKQVTDNCERVLVTLLRRLGPWRESVFLVGGLAPRYIITARPPDVPAHAGTADVDIVVDLEMLADTEAYESLEANLKRMGFERGENDKGQKVNWRWKIKLENGGVLVLEFLADHPDLRGGGVQELPTKGNVSALNIPHASMVFDLHDKLQVTADLLDGGGRATETVAYANLVSFVCLKAFAYDQRHERKDAHDLVYCLEHAEGGRDAVIAQFREALKGKHAETIRTALDLLRRRFCDPNGEGYLLDGPVAVANFEPAPDDGARDFRVLRQRNVNALMEAILAPLKD